MYPQTLRNHFPEPRTDTHKGGFTMALYIGLMSGTSADAIDVALADFSREHGIRQVASLEKKMDRRRQESHKFTLCFRKR